MASETPASREIPAVSVAVDLAIFTVRDDELQVLFIDRGKQPFLGQPALPGGYLRGGEDLKQAAMRELREETGIDGHQLHLQQLGAYSDPCRDPRERVVSVAYLALGPDLPTPTAGTDARAAYWKPVAIALDHATRLAFDHSEILRDALERARSQLEYTTVATAFCPEPFTITELRHVYEAVGDSPLSQATFAARQPRLNDLLNPPAGNGCLHSADQPPSTGKAALTCSTRHCYGPRSSPTPNGQPLRASQPCPWLHRRLSPTATARGRGTSSDAEARSDLWPRCSWHV